MSGVRRGNALIDGASRKGWYIGRFVDDDAYRQTHGIEVKWGVHKEGDSNASFAAESVARKNRCRY